MNAAKTGGASFPENHNDAEETGAFRPVAVDIDLAEDEGPDDRLTARIPRLSLDFDLAVKRAPRRRTPILDIIARARSLKPRHAARPR